MDNNQFEAQMRAGERFHGLRLPAGAWPVIRVDGHGFSRFTATHFEKPFDERFHIFMLQTAQALLEQLHGLYAYTESDEISILLPHNWNLFDRSQEKAVSLSAGIASATFTQSSGHPAHFDSRIWLGEDMEAVSDYFRWRQSDAARCALNGWCYWTLRQKGHSVRQATKALEKQPVEFKTNLLTAHGITFAEVPAWQRHGVGLWWGNYEKEGFDPFKQQKVVAQRRRIRVDKELPFGDDYAALIRALISSVNT